MNYNDLIAQQQAALNQLMHNAQQRQWAMIAVWLAGVIISAIVLYLFYARLRDIADELRKFRIAYEMAEERKLRTPQFTALPSRLSADERYMPKSPQP